MANNNIRIIRHSLEYIIDYVVENREVFVNNPKTDFARNTKITFKDVIKIILSMKGEGVDKELYDYFVGDIDRLCTSAGFRSVRKKLKDNVFEFIFDMFNILVLDKKTYKGYRLLAVDGSEIDFDSEKMGNLEEDVDENIEDNTFESAKCNLYHLNVVYDLLNKTYINAILQTKGEINERKALITMLQNTNHTEKTLYICDRGYPSWNVFTHFKYTENADFLIRYPNKGSNLTASLPDTTLDIERNIVTTSIKDYNSIKYLDDNNCYVYVAPNATWDFGNNEKIRLRIVKFEFSPGEYETIITSLSQKEFPLEEIKKLYKMRWGVEISFKNFKYPMGINQLSNRRKDFVKQDIFARLTMYNFYQRIMNEVENGAKQEGDKAFYANFVMGSHICRDYFLDKISDDAVDILISKYSYFKNTE